MQTAASRNSTFNRLRDLPLAMRFPADFAAQLYSLCILQSLRSTMSRRDAISLVV
ncbi:hypothetical protein RESH_06140 [Rhodopirellula europaea SH398]|uniref:Uncharacterized protein n=1 Tax=Rhodopirellula europaea SH398 TaxID=1263868 RepID=M5RV66_9BACT|nr:hypothetical protein RESH_06140 [Rhodopirellula europaea SH398]